MIDQEDIILTNLTISDLEDAILEVYVVGLTALKKGDKKSMEGALKRCLLYTSDFLSEDDLKDIKWDCVERIIEEARHLEMDEVEI